MSCDQFLSTQAVPHYSFQTHPAGLRYGEMNLLKQSNKLFTLAKWLSLQGCLDTYVYR